MRDPDALALHCELARGEPGCAKEPRRLAGVVIREVERGGDFGTDGFRDRLAVLTRQRFGHLAAAAKEGLVKPNAAPALAHLSARRPNGAGPPCARPDRLEDGSLGGGLVPLPHLPGGGVHRLDWPG